MAPAVPTGPRKANFSMANSGNPPQNGDAPRGTTLKCKDFGAEGQTCNGIGGGVSQAFDLFGITTTVGARPSRSLRRAGVGTACTKGSDHAAGARNEISAQPHSLAPA